MLFKTAEVPVGADCHPWGNGEGIGKKVSENVGTDPAEPKRVDVGLLGEWGGMGTWELRIRRNDNSLNADNSFQIN